MATRRPSKPRLWVVRVLENMQLFVSPNLPKTRSFREKLKECLDSHLAYVRKIARRQAPAQKLFKTICDSGPREFWILTSFDAGRTIIAWPREALRYWA